MNKIRRPHQWVVYNETGKLRSALSLAPEASPSKTFGITPCKSFTMRGAALVGVKTSTGKSFFAKAIVDLAIIAGWEFAIGIKKGSLGKWFSLVVHDDDVPRFEKWLEVAANDLTPKQTKVA